MSGARVEYAIQRSRTTDTANTGLHIIWPNTYRTQEEADRAILTATAQKGWVDRIICRQVTEWEPVTVERTG